MRITELFLSTTLIAVAILLVALPFLARMRSEVLWQRWYTWLGITVVFSSAYLAGGLYFRALIVACSMVMLFELLFALKASNFAIALIALVVWSNVFNLIVRGTTTWEYSITLLLVTGAALVDHLDLTFIKYGFFTLFGTLLVIVFFTQLIYYPDKALALLLVVGVFDVASYVGGKSLGKAKFFDLKIFPKASPNKTLGGLIIGLSMAAVIMLLLGKFTVVGWVVLVVGAVLGDYLESKFKRAMGTKDTGSWLPGFGGLLDRFDSVLLLAPLIVFIF